MSGSSVLAVVVTYNGREWIRRCLGSLRDSPNVTDIFVIDNDSDDGTPALVEQLFPNVMLVRSDTNLGFGAANNIGLQKAVEEAYEYVFLLNQDAWLQPGAVASLLASFAANPAYGLISPMHLNGKGDALEFDFSVCLRPTACANIYSDLILKDEPAWDSVYEAGFINAAAWFMSVDAVRKVGGFDPLFFHYGEDANYINRLRYHDIKVGVCPRAFIHHDQGEHRDRSYRDAVLDHTSKLIQWTDPCRPFNYPKLKWIYRLRMLKLFLESNEEKLSRIKEEYNLLREHAEEIVASRAICKQKPGPFLTEQYRDSGTQNPSAGSKEKKQQEVL